MYCLSLVCWAMGWTLVASILLQPDVLLVNIVLAHGVDPVHQFSVTT